MKIGIISDIHGNLEAIQAVLNDIEAEGIEEILFLGDVVGYGADPEACINLLKNNADILVAGNHDYGAVGLTSIYDFNTVARDAIIWTKCHLSEEGIEFLSQLKLSIEYKDITIVHSSPQKPEKWHYIFTEEDAISSIIYCNTTFCFIGHSHRPFIFVKSNIDRNQYNLYRDRCMIDIAPGYTYMINVGSVGQPRDGNPDASYAILDMQGGVVKIKRVKYDIRLVQKKIIDAGLPAYLAQRLSYGR